MPTTPAQRNTRSNSNSSTISINDIKTLIDGAKTEILQTVKEDNNRLSSLLTTLLGRIETLEEKNRMLEAKCIQLEENVHCHGAEAPTKEMPDETVFQEMMERHRRRKFLIISGMPEAASGTAAERKSKDLDSVMGLASQLGINDFIPTEASRIGSTTQAKPRLLRIKCKSQETKRELLVRARNLREYPAFRGVYINPDRTLMQREADRALRMELRKRREAGEHVSIRRGRIINAMHNENFRPRF